MEIPRPQGSPTTAHLPRPARKGASTRAWLVLGSSGGGSHVEELGKHAIMKRTGLPARDLRILDPALSYPSTVLGRERAIVVKLEHIKAIITAQEVLVQNPRDPLVAPFVSDLLVRLTAGGKNAAAPTMPLTSEPYKHAGESSPYHSSGMDGSTAKAPFGISLDKGSSTNLAMKDGDLSKVEGSRELPFEFKALEASLEYACRSLESETSTLEKEAYPALDALTLKISTLHLERVRQIKSRLVAISGRVQKVRDELENLLDDDMDMAEMYLTEKLYKHEADEISMDQIDGDGDASELDEGDENVTNKDRGSVRSIGFSQNIEDLEMLLEAYFVQIEGTLNKLSTLREYVDDTEDYINIMLDDKQNQLLQMGVMLSTATMLVSAGIAVVGLFGMNIHISLYDATSTSKFWETTCGSAISCMILFMVAVAWGKRKGLLSW